MPTFIWVCSQTTHTYSRRGIEMMITPVVCISVAAVINETNRWKEKAEGIMKLKVLESKRRERAWSAKNVLLHPYHEWQLILLKSSQRKNNDVCLAPVRSSNHSTKSFFFSFLSSYGKRGLEGRNIHVVLVHTAVWISQMKNKYSSLWRKSASINCDIPLFLHRNVLWKNVKVWVLTAKSSLLNSAHKKENTSAIRWSNSF